MAWKTSAAADDEVARLAALPLRPAVGELEPADDLHAESIAAAVNARTEDGALASRTGPVGKHWDALRHRLAETLDETEVADVLDAVAAWLDDIPSARD